MKIVFFINDISCSGGSERVSSVIANHLNSCGYQVIFISWMNGTTPFFKLDSQIKVYALYEKKVNIYKYYLPSFVKYYKILDKIKPDVVVDVCTALTIFSGPMKLIKRFKLISWEHFNTSVNWNPITSRMSRFLAARIANKVVVLTRRDEANYISNYKANNVIHIPNPITLCHNHRTNLNSKIVLSIGRFTKQKGFDRLIAAWSLVAKRHSDWKLKIVGDGELKDSISNQIALLNLSEAIEIHMPTKQIDEFYMNASIYAMASRFEGLPLVLIEAKSYGLPIVSFDCETGPREIVRHQVDGLLINNGEIELFAHGILQLIESQELRIKYGNAAIEDLDRFAASRITKEWLSMLKSI